MSDNVLADRQRRTMKALRDENPHPILAAADRKSAKEAKQLAKEAKLYRDVVTLQEQVELLQLQVAALNNRPPRVYAAPVYVGPPVAAAVSPYLWNLTGPSNMHGDT